MAEQNPERGLKARLLREGIASQPELSPRDLADQLNRDHADKGVTFKPQDVSNARQQEKNRRERQSGATGGRESTLAPSRGTGQAAGLTAADLTQLAGLVRKAGGVKALLNILEAVRGLR